MKYKTLPGVILTGICGKHYLVSPEATIQINETAAFCWKLLEDRAGEEDLCRAMQEQFEDADQEQLRIDAAGLIQSLRARRLIVRCSA